MVQIKPRTSMHQATTPETVSLSYDDIIFQTRNRAYGAFDLRRNYRPTINRALWLGIGLFLLGLAAPTLYDRFWPNHLNDNQQFMEEVSITKITEPPIEKPIPLPPVEQAPAVNTVRDLPPVVLPDADVVEEALPPTVDELKDATAGTVTAEGTGVDEVILAPEASATPTVQEKVVEIEAKPDEPFIAVEQNPEYPGGTEALRTFLSNNLKYPRAAAASGIAGRVYISFVVNTDGSLTDIQVVKGIGFGCDEEAIRVMQKMPRWRPGKQSGRAVRVKFNLPITFTLE